MHFLIATGYQDKKGTVHHIIEFINWFKEMGFHVKPVSNLPSNLEIN